MKRSQTIKSQKEFNYLIKNAKFKKNNYFVIYYNINNENRTMYGIAISRQVGKANERNKLKRQVRNIIDKNQKLFKNNYNYIIMIRKSCKEVKYNILEQALTNLLEK